jgi:hypothetical protein
VVLDHLGGEGDVGVVVLGGADLGLAAGTAGVGGAVATGGEAGADGEGEGQPAERAGTGLDLVLHELLLDVMWGVVGRRMRHPARVPAVEVAVDGRSSAQGWRVVAVPVST